MLVTIDGNPPTPGQVAEFISAFQIPSVSQMNSAIDQANLIGPVGPTGPTGTNGISTQVIPIAVSDETTPLTTGVSKVTFRMPFAFTLTAIRASVTTGPTGLPLIVDVKTVGVSVMTTNKLRIDVGTKSTVASAAPSVLTAVNLESDAEITVDITQVGSTVAGAGLKVYLIGSVT